MNKIKALFLIIFTNILFLTPIHAFASANDLLSPLDSIDNAEIIDVRDMNKTPRLRNNNGSTSITSQEKYDPRVYGKVSSVKDQGSEGLCWAYSINSAAESNLIMNGADTTVDLSEIFYAYYYYKQHVFDGLYPEYDDNGFAHFCNFGGWCGNPDSSNPGEYIDRFAFESDYPMPTPVTDDYEISEEDLDDYAYRISKLYRLEGYDGEAEDIAYTKQILALCGNVLLCNVMDNRYYTNPSSTTDDGIYYYPDLNPSNHAMEIVGWDDNFPRESFSYVNKPKKNGAWLVKNSWGFGDETTGSGYLWISYYDKGIYNIIRGIKVSDKEHYADKRINITCGVGDTVDLMNLCKENDIEDAVTFIDSHYSYTTNATYDKTGVYKYRILDDGNNLIGYITVTVNYIDISTNVYLNEDVDFISLINESTSIDADYVQEFDAENGDIISEKIVSEKYNDYGYHNYYVYRDDYMIGYYRLLVVPRPDAKISVSFSDVSDNPYNSLSIENTQVTLKTPQSYNFGCRLGYKVLCEGIDITGNENLVNDVDILDGNDNPIIFPTYILHQADCSLDYNLSFKYTINYGSDIVKTVTSDTYHINIIPVASSLSFKYNEGKEDYIYVSLNDVVDIESYVTITPSNEEIIVTKDESSDTILNDKGVVTAYGESIYTFASKTNPKLELLTLHICNPQCSTLTWDDGTAIKNITLDPYKEYNITDNIICYPENENLVYKIAKSDTNNFYISDDISIGDKVLVSNNVQNESKAVITVTSTTNPELLLTLNVTLNEEQHQYKTKTVLPTATNDGYVCDNCMYCDKIINKVDIPAIRCTVDQVIDGNTIVVNSNDKQYTVRFIGINTPDVPSDESKNTSEKVAASDYTKNLLSKGTKVYLQYDESYFDTYGRILAYVWLADYDGPDMTIDFFKTYNVGALLLQKAAYCESVYCAPNGRYKSIYDALYKQYQQNTTSDTENNDDDILNNNDDQDNPENQTDIESTEVIENDDQKEETTISPINDETDNGNVTDAEDTEITDGQKEETVLPADGNENDVENIIKPDGEENSNVTDAENTEITDDQKEETVLPADDNEDENDTDGDIENVIKPDDEENSNVTDAENTEITDDQKEETVLPAADNEDENNDTDGDIENVIKPDDEEKSENESDAGTNNDIAEKADDSSSSVDNKTNDSESVTSNENEGEIKTIPADNTDNSKDSIINNVKQAIENVITPIVNITQENTTVIKIQKTKITSAKMKGKSIQIKFNKIKGIKKYQIEISTKPNFKSVKKYTVTKNSKTIKVKKAGKYYIRVRGVNGNNFGKWSKVIVVKKKK